MFGLVRLIQFTVGWSFLDWFGFCAGSLDDPVRSDLVNLDQVRLISFGFGYVIYNILVSIYLVSVAIGLNLF